MLDKTHATIPRPTALIVVSDDTVVHLVGVSAQVALDEAPCLISREVEENVQAINITGVQADGATSLCSRIAILQEVVGDFWRTCHFASSLQAKNEDIKDKTVVLEEGRFDIPTPIQCTPCNLPPRELGKHLLHLFTLFNSWLRQREVLDKEGSATERSKGPGAQWAVSIPL